jgi:hypothetical protein
MPSFFVLFFAINIVCIKFLVKAYYDADLGKSFLGDNHEVGPLVDKHRASYAFFYTAAIYFNFRLAIEGMNFKKPYVLMYIFLVYGVGTLHVVFGVIGYMLDV